jgi:hypothetical protein
MPTSTAPAASPVLLDRRPSSGSPSPAPQGVPLSAGPNEQLACIHQNQLSEEEFTRRSAAANSSTPEVPDADLAARESAAAAERGATTSRLSRSHESREHRLLIREEHTRSFVMDQPRAPGGARRPGGRGRRSLRRTATRTSLPRRPTAAPLPRTAARVPSAAPECRPWRLGVQPSGRARESHCGGPRARQERPRAARAPWR